jgi:hypothetical protein
MVMGKNRTTRKYPAPRRLLFAGLLALLAPLFSLSAETTRQAAVLLSGRPRLGEAASDFESLICTSLQAALEYSGLRVIPGAAAGAEADLLAAARSLAADYLLACEYISRGELLEMELRWFDVGENREAAYLSEQTRMGLSLDAALGRVVREMIAAARPRIRVPLAPPAAAPAVAPAVPETATPAAVAPAAPETATPAAAPAGAAPAGESAGRPAEKPAARPAVNRGAAQASPEEKPTPVAPDDRRRALTLSCGFAPFLADGPAADYLPGGVGIFPSLSVWYRWSFAKAYLGVGLYGGLNIFRSEGPLAFSDSALLPAGLDIRWGVEGRPVGLYLHLSGGPALFSIDPNATGRLVKLTYFGQAGIGVTLPAGRAFGFILDATYILFLEEGGEPIRGLVPGAGIYVRP